MVLFAMLFLAISLMIVALIFKRPAFGFGAAAFWVIAAADCYILAAAGFTVWDMYALASFASFGMAIVSIMEALALRTKKEEIAEDSIDRQIAKSEKYRQKMERVDKATGGRRF